MVYWLSHVRIAGSASQGRELRARRLAIAMAGWTPMITWYSLNRNLKCLKTDQRLTTNIAGSAQRTTTTAITSPSAPPAALRTIHLIPCPEEPPQNTRSRDSPEQDPFAGSFAAPASLYRRHLHACKPDHKRGSGLATDHPTAPYTENRLEDETGRGIQSHDASSDDRAP